MKYSKKLLRGRLEQVMEMLRKERSNDELIELGAKHPKSKSIGVITILDIIFTRYYKENRTKKGVPFNQEEVHYEVRDVARNFANFLRKNTDNPHDRKTNRAIEFVDNYLMRCDPIYAKAVNKEKAYRQAENELAHNFEVDGVLENPYHLTRCYRTTSPVQILGSSTYCHIEMNINPIDCFEGLHCIKEAWIDISIQPVGKNYDKHRFSCVYCPNHYGQLALVVFDCEVETYTNGVIVQGPGDNIQVSIGNGLFFTELMPFIEKDEDGSGE